MDGAAQFCVQRRINTPLALDARKAVKNRRHDPDMEMAFPAGPRAGVPRMTGALILDHQFGGRERHGQFFVDSVCRTHNRRLRVRAPRKSSNSFSCFLPGASHNYAMAKLPPKPRFKSDIRIKPAGASKRAKPLEETRLCAIKDCPKPGTCRVPKSRENIEEYVWLCTAHARQHNESWDFFKGMDHEDIQKFRVEAIIGHRPTWPMGKRGARSRDGQSAFGAGLHANDSHAVFDEDADAPAVRRPERQLTRLQMIALDTMHLPHSATLIEIKARYKELVKRFHPDANGGDRGAEERLKQVIKAYGVLRASGLT
jgi:hypothetical protein